MNLMTDRTTEDAVRWKELRDKGYDAMTAAERAEWAAGMKGAYKWADLNRVGAAQLEVRDRLAAVGVNNLAILGRSNWTDDDVPARSDMERYLADTTALRDGLAVAMSLPASMRRLTVEGANDIERCLLTLDDMVTRIMSGYLPSASTFAVSGAPHIRIGVNDYV